MTGQSATRIHPALDSHATQQWVVKVEDDACLVVLPGPAIPFRGSRYYQRGACRACPACPPDLGRHLDARPIRPRSAFGAIPVRADRPGLRGSSSQPVDLSRSVPMAWTMEARRRQLVLRWSPGLRQPIHRRAAARGTARIRPCAPASSLSARFRRKLPSVVRPSDSCNRGPRANGSRPGSSMDRRARCTPVAARLEWAISQPLVLNPGTIAGFRELKKSRCQNLTKKLIAPVNWL